MRGYDKMPKGLFFLIHDEIKGPEIKCSYFSEPINLPQEFISKLYMSHAGFESSSLIEIKFDLYKSVSCFTGNLDRRSQKEGILGIIFEEHEVYSNLDLFLRRNLSYASNNPDDQTMEEIFSNNLLNYLELVDLFEKVEIEDIPEIFILTGYEEYQSCLLKIGEKKVSNPEMTDIYKKIIDKQIITQYHYVQLNSELLSNIYLVFKVNNPIQDIDKIISTIKTYLDNFFYYSVEILALFFLPTIVRIVPHTPKLASKYFDKYTSILQNLQKSEDYTYEFNNLVSYLIKGDINLSPLL